MQTAANVQNVDPVIKFESIYNYPIICRDLYSPLPDPPQTRRYPQSRRNYPQANPKIWYVPEVYKMTKVLEDGRKMGKKSIFH